MRFVDSNYRGQAGAMATLSTVAKESVCLSLSP